MSPSAEPAATPYQSLYRRFRPQRFSEVLGQEHVSLALRNAVRDGRVGHAYLFSGPRGTGKTSTARILAKALDCAAPEDGEPCCVCDSCVEIARGTSLDVHELDAASNNGVDAMRDLVAHSALGTPGRWKVYIVDEVHMLSTAASNALLKTLEEPPSHVVFVLATTDARKVLPTIRSRTQHFEFRLLGPEILSGLLESVREHAGLEVGDDALESAVRRGRGSARDALSALDQVAAGGTVHDDIAALAEMTEAIAGRDPHSLLVAVAKTYSQGHDPQRLAAELCDYLREGFLCVLSPELVSMAGAERERVEVAARSMGLPALVRAMEALGRALVDMRDSPEPRVHLEATLIRLAHPEMEESISALIERVERLERALASTGGDPPPPPARLTEVPAPADAPPPARAGRGTARPAGGGSRGAQGPGPDVGSEEPHGAGSGPEMARRVLSQLRAQEGRASPRGASLPVDEVPVSGDPPARAPVSSAGGRAATSRALPSRDELVQVWGDELLASLPSRARVRFRVGRFLDNRPDAAVFALPSEGHRAACEELLGEVEQALARHFGRAVPLLLMVDDEDTDEPRARTASPPRSSRPAPREPQQDPDEPEPDLLDPAVLEAETLPAGAGPTPEERIKLAFPGAEEV